jgi:hypothetical protein
MNIRIYFIWALLALGGIEAWAQASLGFTNANGFPTVIVGSQNYTLSGWLKNTGNVAFSGQLDIRIKIDTSSAITVQNNFNVNPPLQPGDSTFWQRNNYNFPPGHFRMSNNDVLIWPTLPSGGPGINIDTLHMQMFYTSGSALETEYVRTHPGGNGNGPGVRGRYAMHIKGNNVSPKSTVNPICVYVRTNGTEAKCAGTVKGPLHQGDKVSVWIQDFCIQEFFGISNDDPKLYDIDRLYIYMQEVGEDFNPYNIVELPVERLVGNHDATDRNAVQVFPSPFDNELQIKLPHAMRPDAQLRLYDLRGKLVHQQALQTEVVDLSALPPGSYMLEVTSKHGTHRQQVICK